MGAEDDRSESVLIRGLTVAAFVSLLGLDLWGIQLAASTATSLAALHSHVDDVWKQHEASDSAFSIYIKEHIADIRSEINALDNQKNINVTNIASIKESLSELSERFNQDRADRIEADKSQQEEIRLLIARVEHIERVLDGKLDETK